jgi:hypothetical protein
LRTTSDPRVERAETHPRHPGQADPSIAARRLLALQRSAGNSAVAQAMADLTHPAPETVQRAPVFTPEDDATIQSIITNTEAAHPLPYGPDGKRPYPFFDVKAAAADLKGQRDGSPLDTNLAAAEHYMFARYLAHYGIGNPLFMAIQSGSYQLFKLLANNRWDDAASPRTPPSYTQFKWAMQGSADGTGDLL